MNPLANQLRTVVRPRVPVFSRGEHLVTGVFIGAINRLGVESPWDILSNVKGVGAGVFECRIDFGPGYRLHFGQDGDTLIILLRGGISGRRHHFERTAT